MDTWSKVRAKTRDLGRNQICATECRHLTLIGSITVGRRPSQLSFILSRRPSSPSHLSSIITSSFSITPLPTPPFSLAGLLKTGSDLPHSVQAYSWECIAEFL